jgi:adenylate cyclase
VSNLFAELKRRNVFRVGLFYVVTAWLVIEVAETVLPLFDVPDGVLRGLVVLLVIGLVPALGLSWIYELTPEGIKRDAGPFAADTQSSATGRKLNWATLVVAVLAIGLLVSDRLFREPASTGPTVAQQDARSDREAGQMAQPDAQADAKAFSQPVIPDASIAVLPFADLSPEGDQQYFSDGIAEEILNVLSRIEALNVTSRTSAFAFKSQSELSIRDIATSLGVRHVLEGSVRKAADTIRVTAQLIDARSDQRVWSETFERQLTAQNVFAIQDEIAAAITSALASRLDVRIDAAPGAAGGTSDIDAYQAFLAGRDLFINRNYDNLARAIAMLEQAVEADPDFERARGWLAMAYIVAPHWGYIDRDYSVLGIQAAEKALVANPANAEALTALGLDSSASGADYAAAIDYYERAITADPQATTAHLWLAQSWRELGFFDRAAAAADRCLDLDPNYPVCIVTRAEIATLQGRYDEAVAGLMKSFETSHQESYPQFLGIVARQGDEVLLTLMLRELADIVGPDSRWIVPELRRALSDEQYERDAALARFEARLRAEHPESPGAADPYVVTAWRLAFRAYDRIPLITGSLGWWWGLGYPGLAESPHRREAMIHARLPEYWRAHGFPPQCRPVGADDFACD